MAVLGQSRMEATCGWAELLDARADEAVADEGYSRSAVWLID